MADSEGNCIFRNADQSIKNDFNKYIGTVTVNVDDIIRIERKIEAFNYPSN